MTARPSLYLIYFAVLAGTSSIVWPAPPPPIPPSSPDVAMQLSRAYDINNISSYITLFAEDVQITENGMAIGSGIEFVRSKFAKDHLIGLAVSMMLVARGGPEVLLFERVTNVPPIGIPGEVHDCCTWFRSEKLTINNDYKIVRIDILDAPATSELKSLDAALRSNPTRR